MSRWDKGAVYYSDQVLAEMTVSAATDQTPLFPSRYFAPGTLSFSLSPQMLSFPILAYFLAFVVRSSSDACSCEFEDQDCWRYDPEITLKTFTNIQENVLKTITSASKIDIKCVLESLYGFEVEKVQTLNMEGKKKKWDGLLITKPDYKKAYVTLKNPFSISPYLYPIRIIKKDKKRVNNQTKSNIVEEETHARSHWLNDKKEAQQPFRAQQYARLGRRERARHAKFPWSSMSSNSSSTR